MSKRVKKADFVEIAKKAIESENWNLLIENARAYMDYIGRPLSIDEFKNVCGIHITEKHTGKMTGMLSLSTSCIENQECKRHMSVEGSICEHCFANSLLKQRKTMRPALQQNFKILNAVVIPVELWPILNVRFFRTESFGDLGSATHTMNYFNFMYRNSATSFGMWTKNYKFIRAAIEEHGYKKPKNVKIVVSSLFLNIQLNIKLYKYADKVFTVYSREYVKEHPEIVINCGKRHCLSCLNCYRDNEIVYINELLK